VERSYTAACCGLYRATGDRIFFVYFLPISIRMSFFVASITSAIVFAIKVLVCTVSGIDYMYPRSIIGYISSLGRDYKKDLDLDNTALDILQQFACEEYLSAYNLFLRLNSMDLKIAYKNVRGYIRCCLQA
jgi:hypothetical protein